VATKAVSERAVLVVVGLVQFVNILDFMMVMPLGPDFSRGLGIPLSHLGYIGGSYTAAAAVSGVLGALFLDRFDRRAALFVAMLGLSVGTLAGGFATGFPSLLAARIVAGLFGGPATSIAYSIIADVVPSERRGRAMGAVMGAFSLASVFGVPLGLELAHIGTFRTPFFVVALLGLAAAAAGRVFLPSLRGHLAKGVVNPPLTALLRTDVVLSLSLTALLTVSTFVLVPNISSYVLQNLEYPRSRLGVLYLVGGSLSFFSMRLVGRIIDRVGSALVGTVGTLFYCGVVVSIFLCVPPLLPIIVAFAGFMVINSSRMVAHSTLTSKVPSSAERARFGSVQSAVQHLTAALGAFLSARMLTESDKHTLVGMPRVAGIAVAFAVVVPVLFYAVERRVRAQGAAALATAAPVPSGSTSQRNS
jgi:predicted MFS family arabinose efflux permease